MSFHSRISIPRGACRNAAGNDEKCEVKAKGGVSTDTREIMSRIKRIDAIINKRNARNHLSRYNTGETVHEKQLDFHRAKHRNRWVFGGNRSGKTECGAVETVWRARGIHPYRENRKDTEGWVVSLTREVQREVAQRKVLHYLNPMWIEDVVMVSGKSFNPKGGVIDYIAVKNVFGGISRICFKSCEMGREKFQGASLDYVWFDEEPPEDIYDECCMRVFDRCGDIYGTMTPLKGLTFIYNRIYLNDRRDAEVWHIFMEWADNPYLDRGEIDKLTAAMTKGELEVRRYGRFSAAAGLVYPEFDERVHVIEPFAVPKEWYDRLSIDPGLNNPTACHFYAVDYDGNVYVVAEHYAAGKPVHEHAAAILEIAKRLSWPTDAKGRVEALIDSAASQRTLAASKSVAELFYEQGVLTDTRVNKDVFAGISRVKSYLRPVSGPPKLYIFSCCTELIREMKGYFFGSGDRPVKSDDHALDELRYYIMSRPHHPRPAAQKSEILKDKERLIRGRRRGG